MTTESWDYWHLTPLMWFLLEKQTCFPAQLSKVLYINRLTKRHSRGGQVFFWIVVYCVVVPAVKEHLRGSIGLPEIYRAVLLLDKRRAPCNLQGCNELSTPLSFSSAAFTQYL